MVGALSLVGSSVVDAHTCPCLCLDSLPTVTSMSLKSVGGDLGHQRNYSVGKKKLLVRRTQLTSSFLDSSTKMLSGVKVNRSFRRQRKSGRRVIVSELGGQYEDTFEDVKRQMVNYFTSKAVRTVLHQLYELNPTQYRWFYDFVVSNKPGDGKRFLRNLGKEKRELAERVMVTRLHLYGKWIKKCDHAQIYKDISDENLELMRERLMETVIWPSDDANTETIG